MPRGLIHAEDAEQTAAFLTEAALIYRFFVSLGEPAPPPIAPARGAPAWADDLGPMRDFELIAQPDPGFAFDQRVSW